MLSLHAVFFLAVFSPLASAAANRAVGSRVGSGAGAAAGAAACSGGTDGGPSGVGAVNGSGAALCAVLRAESVNGIMPRLFLVVQILCRRTEAVATRATQRSDLAPCEP